MTSTPIRGLGTGPKADAARKEFATMMMAFAEITKERLSVMAIQTYEMVLFPTYTLAQVQNALSELMLKSKFVPKPAEIAEHIDGQPERVAIQAWAKVRASISEIGRFRSVVFDDPAIHFAIDGMGGWAALCERLKTDAEFRMEVNEPEVLADFKARYLAYRGEHPPVLIGLNDAPRLLAGLPSSPEVVGEKQKALDVWRSGNQKLLGKVKS
jgi:hypothetical protein